MKDTIRDGKRNVGLFFIITFVFSWLIWLPFVLYSLDLIHLSEKIVSLAIPSVMLGAFAPMISALILIGKEEGKPGIKAFFRKAFIFRIKPLYYILAFLLPFTITAAAHYITNISGIDTLPNTFFPDNLPVPVFLLVIPYFLFIAIAGGGQEEFGWRGYAQEPLQKRFGILGASILIGVVWGLWHLPLWYMPGDGHAYYSFFAFLLYTVSTSVIIGWLYNASGKRLLIAWILHTAGNVAVPFFPTMHMESLPQPGYWIWASISAVAAICLSVWYMLKLRKNPAMFDDIK